MKTTIAVLVVAAFSLITGAAKATTFFYDSELSGEKERHCNRIVSRFGPESGRMNNSRTPAARDWRTRDIDEPGWFDSDLYIRKEQTSSDGFYHLATCHWDKVGGFTLYLYNSRYAENVISCYDFGSAGDGTACE